MTNISIVVLLPLLLSTIWLVKAQDPCVATLNCVLRDCLLPGVDLTNPTSAVTPTNPDKAAESTLTNVCNCLREQRITGLDMCSSVGSSDVNLDVANNLVTCITKCSTNSDPYCICNAILNMQGVCSN